MRQPLPLVVAGVAFAAMLLPTPAAVAAPSLHLEGHGYGHGKGMSQYGAYGAALQGRTANQILAYYYPGTSIGTSTAPIKVRLVKDEDSTTIVYAEKGLRLYDSGTRKVTKPPTTGNPAGATIKQWRLTRVADGSSRLSYLTDTWRSLKTMTGEGEFRSLDGNLVLRRPDADVKYWGSLRQTGGLTVNTVSLDKYVRGVVPREVFTSWPAAALQAQSVAARTYGAFERNSRKGKPWHVYSDTRSQVYGGMADEVASTNAAVAATSNQIRTYGGEPAFTQFCSSSGGFSVSGGFPYLKAKADKFDDFAKNPMHTWTVTIEGTAISSAYPEIGSYLGLKVLSRDGLGGDYGGRATSVQITGTTETITDTAANFRAKLVLRSTWFKVLP